MFSKNHIINVTAIIFIVLMNSMYMLVFSPKIFLNPAFTLLTFVVLFLFIIRSVYLFSFNDYKVFNKSTVLVFLILISLVFLLIISVFSGLLPFNKFLLAKSKLLNMDYHINNLQGYRYAAKGTDNVEMIRRTLGVIGFFLSGYFYVKNSKTIKFTIIQFVIILFTPIIYLGIIVSGEILFLLGLINLLIVEAEKSERKNKDLFVLIIGGCIAGVFLYFNLAVILLIIIFTLYYYRNNLVKAFGFLLLSILCFLLFDYFTGSMLFKNNVAGMLWLFIIFIMIVLYLGWSVSNIYEVFFASGIIIFIFLTSIIFADMYYHNIHAVLSRSYGLNFSMFCIPILLLNAAMHEYNIDKFLGKVLPDFN